MHRASTALASWVCAIYRTLHAYGCDADRIVAQAGIRPEDLANPLARIPVSHTTSLWRLATLASGDAAFGISVASHVRANTFQALGLSLAASPSLHEAFHKLLRYFRIITDAGELRLSMHGEHCHLELAVTDLQCTSYEALDALMSCIVRMCRSLANPRSAEPMEIRLRRPRPNKPERFEDAFRCPIHYGAESNVLLFSAQDVTMPLPGGNAALSKLHDSLLNKMLADVDNCNINQRVLFLLLDLLPQGGVTQCLIAQRLDMSTRTLQRQLKAQSTSYENVLDEARLTVALKLLSEDACSLNQIAYKLGFSDVSGFSRFFKRRQGQTPGVFRHRQLRKSLHCPDAVNPL